MSGTWKRDKWGRKYRTVRRSFCGMQEEDAREYEDGWVVFKSGAAIYPPGFWARMWSDEVLFGDKK